jgi:hypothetical protein
VLAAILAAAAAVVVQHRAVQETAVLAVLAGMDTRLSLPIFNHELRNC